MGRTYSKRVACNFRTCPVGNAGLDIPDMQAGMWDGASSLSDPNRTVRW